MTPRLLIGFAFVMAAALLMPPHPAMAKGGKGGGAAVVIDSMQFTDLPGGKKNVEILGGGFTGSSGFPVVTLDGLIELDVLEASSTAISANIPKNTPDGDPVIGAAVDWESFVDGRKWYDYHTTTYKYAGYNHGESCPIEVAQASGATGQNCCIGNATDPPDDSRSCEPGFYYIEVISIQAPPGSDRKWDGITPPNGRDFVQP